MPRSLDRTLGFTDLLFIVIGTVIGSGIFIVPATVLRQTGGALGPAMLVWFVAGILSLLGALTYGEMGAAKPDAGGLYSYIRDAFGPLPAFLYGWTLFLVIGPGAVATLAVAFATYLGEFVVLEPAAAKGAAMAMIAVIGTLTALLAATIGCVQNHIKRVLAYSTVSQLGFMFTALGVGSIAQLWVGQQFRNDALAEVVGVRPGRPAGESERVLDLGALSVVLVERAVVRTRLCLCLVREHKRPSTLLPFRPRKERGGYRSRSRCLLCCCRSLLCRSRGFCLRLLLGSSSSTAG